MVAMDKDFAGSIPEIYDRLLVPSSFTLARSTPRDALLKSRRAPAGDGRRHGRHEAHATERSP